MKYNLNELSHDTAIGLLKRIIDNGVNVKEVTDRISECWKELPKAPLNGITLGLH